MVDHLAYGDIIRIYCTLQDIQDKNQKSQRTSTKIAGFLLSKGFADNNIYFLKSKKFTEFEFRNSLFQILPYSSFEIHDQNRERLKRLSKNPPAAGAGKDQDDENIKSRMDTEKEQFKNKTNKNRGLNINFDSEVVIRHVNSQSFLQGEFSCPETGIGSFKLVLTNEYSSLIKFKIIRFRNSDKEAEEIQSKDQFRLHHCASHCFLNIGNQDDEVFLDKPVRVELDSADTLERKHLGHSILPVITDIFDEASMYHSMRPMIKKPTSTSQSNSQDDVPKRYEVVNQSKATLILNFMPEKSSKAKNLEPEKGESKKETEEMGDIEHNDIVFLKNTKNDSSLTVDLWSGDVYLRQDKSCYEGLWEVCVRRDPEKGSISSNAGRTFYLKHYITDAIAKVSYQDSPMNRDLIKEEDQGISILGDELNRNDTQKILQQNNRSLSIKVDPRPDPRAKVMRLLKYPDSKGSLKHRDLVVLSVMTLQQNSGKDLHQSKADLKKQARKEEQLQTRKLFIDIADPIKKIHMTDILKKSEDSSNSFKLKLCKGDIENTFQIFKFDQKLLRNINKILSCQEAFAKFCDILIVFNKLLKKQIELSKSDKRPEEKKQDQIGVHSEMRLVEGMRLPEAGRKHRGSFAAINLGSPKSEQVVYVNAKEDHIEGFFNKFLNSYILVTVGNTTLYLIKNCRTGSKTEFQFIIMIRSLGLIEVLIEIIYFIEQILSQWEAVFKGSSHSDNNISKRKYEKDRLSEIFKDVYRLLTMLSGEKSCKIYMARWLPLFLKQYYKLKKEFMHEFILQVLQDPFIIKNCIKEENIQECMMELRRNFSPEAPEEKYLQLLSAFCRNKSNAVPGNQLFIMNSFLKPN